MDGLEVLKEMKRDPNLKTIPVVVLTTSENPEDVTQSYQLHANSFVTKPSRLEQFLETVRSLVDFWFHTAELPTEKPPAPKTMTAHG
jgi:CheY-like chemotaxis protein